MNSFFGIGILELMLIIVLAIIVLGPERMPGVIRQIAKFIRQMRAIGSELTSQFSEELEMLDELNPRKILDEATAPVKEDIDAIQEMTGKKKPSTKATEKTAAKTAEKADAKTDTKTTAKTSEKKSEGASGKDKNESPQASDAAKSEGVEKPAQPQKSSIGKPSLGETMEEPQPQTMTRAETSDNKKEAAQGSDNSSDKAPSETRPQSVNKFSTGQSLTNGVMPKKAEEPVVENSIAPPELLKSATERSTESPNGSNGRTHEAETPVVETVTEEN